jgi:hypothetical protein
MKNYMKYLSVFLVLFTTFAHAQDFTPNTTVYGYTYGYDVLFASNTVFRKEHIPLRAVVLSESNDSVTLTNIIVNKTITDMGPFHVAETSRGKRFICAAFNLRELQSFSTKAERNYVKIRCLNSAETGLYAPNSKLVFATVTCAKP